MATVTERLKWLIEADASSAIKGFEATGAAAEKGLGKAETKIAKLGGKMTKFGAGAVAFAGIAGVALFEAAKSFEETALKAGEFSDATGVSVEEGSKLIQVAKDLDVEVGSLQGALGKMDKALGNTPEKFQALGIEIAKTKAGTTDVNGTFLNTIDRLQEMKDPAERAAAAAAIFGKGWQGAAELLATSTDDIKARLAAVSDAKVINEEELAKAKQFRDNLNELKHSAQDFVIAIGEGATPVIGTFSSIVGGAVGGLTKLDSVSSGAAGSLLAGGVAAVGMAGALSLIIGQAIKLGNKMTTVGAAGTKSLNGIGIAAVVAGVAMTGLALHTAEQAKQTAAMNKAFDELSKVADAEVLKEFNQAVEHGVFIGNSATETLKQMAHANLEGAQRVLDYTQAQIAAGTAGEGAAARVKMLTAAIDAEKQARVESAKATEDATVALDDNVAATDDMNDRLQYQASRTAAAEQATKDLAKAQEIAKDKAKEHADQLQREIDKLETLYPKAYDAVQAHFAYKEAVAESDAAIKGLNDRSKDQQDELDTAKEKILDTAKQYATMDGAAEGSEGAIRRQIDSLKAQEDSLAPNSPLRVFLDEYIAALEAIPSQIATELNLHISQGQVTTAAGDVIGVHAKAGTHKQFAEGGVVPGPTGAPVEATVHGGEMVLTPEQQQGLGGNTYHVNVTAGWGADGGQIGTAIVAELKKFERRNGPAWRS